MSFFVWLFFFTWWGVGCNGPHSHLLNPELTNHLACLEIQWTHMTYSVIQLHFWSYSSSKESTADSVRSGF